MLRSKEDYFSSMTVTYGITQIGNSYKLSEMREEYGLSNMLRAKRNMRNT